MTPNWIKRPRDFVGGVVLMALALFALWASRDLQGMDGPSFGGGTAPRMFAGILFALGFGVMLVGILSKGPPIQKYHFRGPFFISLAIVSFAITIRPLGLLIAAFVSFMLAALGTDETRWGEAIIVGICLTVGCGLLFPYALGLPFQLFPRFLLQ